ncbi:unnamed protein product [Menidia menidia]|uniref:(Atlantic silverside) hypothetical protein n=1 Tax=Menidia menidia TaxID=238744 RepID=A0A8S4AKR9_9TELE|nr:unnamed protein product [Menidia menidia]
MSSRPLQSQAEKRENKAEGEAGASRSDWSCRTMGDVPAITPTDGSSPPPQPDRTHLHRSTAADMDLHRISGSDPMDYSRETKEGKAAPQSTEERLDSGVESMKEEDYQAVTAEILRLQLETERRQPPAVGGGEPLSDWQTHITEDGDT